MNCQHMSRFAIAIGCALGAVAMSVPVGTPSPASAAASLVPTAAVYASGGPDTPLPLSYTTTAAAAELVVTAEGFVSSVSCPTSFSAAVSEGVGVIRPVGSASIAASTPVPCTVSLRLGDGAPAAVTVAVSERDGFNAELAVLSQVVTLEEIAVTVSVGAVSLTGGTYREAEPRSPGDTLTRPVTFALDAPRAMTFVAPAGSPMTGCSSQTGTTATCTVTRTLSVDDLALGTAAFAPTLLVDGFPVARPIDVDVPSERRLDVTATASAGIVRVGEAVTVDAVVTNLGTIALTGLALGGTAGMSDATCGGDDPAGLTLAPGDSVTCTASHVATADDTGAVRPVTARATSPFGTDSDLVDDDPTSSSDIDAGSGVAPYSVVDADVAAGLSFGTAVAFVDDPGPDRLAGTITVSSAGSLSGAAVAVPLHPAPGVTVAGCDTISDDLCRFDLGGVSPDAPATRSFELEVDPAALAGGPDGTEIGGELTADGGVSVALAPGVLRTAGLRTSVVPAIADVSTPTASFDVDVVAAPGHPVTVEFLASPRGAEPVACRNSSGSDLPLTEAGTSTSLGAMEGGTSVRCTFRQDVVDADRTAGSMPVEVAVLVRAGGQELRRDARGDLDTAALVVLPGAVPEAPPHGYSVDGSPERPNSVTYRFELVAYGRLAPAGPAPVAVTFAGSDPTTCEPAGSPSRLRCEATHTVAAADLARGRYEARIEASAGGVLARSSMTIPMPSESLDVLVTELSTPKQSSGYQAGESIRLLVQMRNRGSLPLALASVAVGTQGAGSSTASSPSPSPSTSTARDARADRADAIIGCSAGTAIAPGELADCTLDLVVQPGFAGDRILVVVTTQQGMVASYSLTVAADPTVPTASPQPEAPPLSPSNRLPATGTDPVILAAAALALCVVGAALRAGSRRGGVSDRTVA